MNISHWLVSARGSEFARCPDCHFICGKHGFYVRKGFHREPGKRAVRIAIIRYRCKEPGCKRCTFSVLPPLVLPYCRFIWRDLLRVEAGYLGGESRYSLACAWKVDWGVLGRATALLEQMRRWVGDQYREVMDGAAAAGLGGMVRLLVARLGRAELVGRWYRHRYPRRAC
jgi:hypothetical protein